MHFLLHLNLQGWLFFLNCGTGNIHACQQFSSLLLRAHRYTFLCIIATYCQLAKQRETTAGMCIASSMCSHGWYKQSRTHSKKHSGQKQGFVKSLLINSKQWMKKTTFIFLNENAMLHQQWEKAMRLFVFMLPLYIWIAIGLQANHKNVS